MEGDNSASDGNASPTVKTNNHHTDEPQVNGVSNGYSDKHKSHKSEHKDKHRDRDRDKDKSRSKDHKSSKDKDRDKDRDKDKDRSKHSSSSKDKDRDKDKDRHSSHKSSSKDKDRDKERDKDKDRHRDKHKSSSSSKDKDRDKDKEKDRDKEHKSSKDKEHKSSSRDKDRDRDKDKDRHKHSSSKDKHKDKHRDKDRDRHSSSKDKDRKDKERKSEKNEIKEEEPKIEEEPSKYEQEVESAKEDSVDEDEQKLVIKEDADSQDEEIPNANISAASSCDYNISHFKDQSKYDDFDEQEEDEEYKPKQEVKDEPVAEEEESEDDVPLIKPVSRKLKLSVRMNNSKRKMESEEEEDEDDVPLSARKKIKKEKKSIKREAEVYTDEDEEDEYSSKKRAKKEKKAKKAQSATKVKKEKANEVVGPKKKKKKEEEEKEVWKWWEEEKKDDGTKWKFLEHKGPVFAPPYERLPKNVKFFYDGKEMELSEEAEEVGGFYARMLDHDYTSKEVFNTNFFKDWRKVMTDKEKAKITDLKKCNFKQMHAFFMDQADKNRNRTKDEKAELKAKNEEILKEYGFCTIDGHKEKIGNFKIEPPGLFRGRGEHPKMGMLKKRVNPEDILINCSKDSVIPKPPPGRKWREVRHDDKVTWLASWTENVQNQVKYIMLNPSSKLKGEKDWQKYETARRLHKTIEKIRSEYKEDWKSKEMRVRQRAVALYFIDKLALRAGNEKDEDQADTVGCCSLRVEHIQLHEHKDDKDYVVTFDFLGKDSIRYYNEVPVEKRVFKNLQLFMENKAPGDDLFDRLNTALMNKHLNELMTGLTAKVFRTYNASFTLQQQLDKLTNADDSISEKILSYNRANRAVAILCNHQRAVPKGHQKSMEKLKEKIDAKRDAIADAEKQVKDAQRASKHGSVKEKVVYDKKKKMLERLREQLAKLEIQETDRDENKTIALGTSKLNYLDPRISVAWCKKFDVPIDKIYNKTQRDKFRWAIDMATADYVF